MKVKPALDLLYEEHFDIVTMGHHDVRTMELLRQTGWEDIEMERTNTASRDIQLSKSEVEKLQKLLNANGDIDFL